jgi:chemosensory pili system protein ChpA (sensor histidine kinase/response regulator)
MTKAPFILIVEDDSWLAEQYARTLKQANMQSAWVEHAIGAMDMIDTHRPDVILLDVLLTGQTAFTLLHELRSHADLSAIPVILCTNTASDLPVEDMLSYGVRQVLDKATMTPQDIVAAIKKVLP